MDKFIKIPAIGFAEEIKKYTEELKNNEMKWSYYSTEGDKSYHFYLIIKK